MGKPNRLFIILTAALVLIFALSIVGGSAQASTLNAPRTKTPTPGIATSTPTIAPTATQASGAPIVSSTELTQGWSLISANNVTDSGATISQTGYNVSTSWYPITVPSTVLAGLVANNVYQNIYFGTNLQSVPDLTTQNWWYRGQFNAPASGAGQQYWLRFKGVSYRAQVWLNGTQLVPSPVGTMVINEYNVTNLIHAGAANAVALLVTPPAHNCNNLSFCYVDWNPEAPDMNAGLWGKVFLDTTGAVALRDPYVKTVLPLPATNSADLTVYVDALNGTNSTISGTVSGTITKSGYPTISFSKPVTLNPGRQEITLDPASFPQLHVSNPALWWPYQFGSPELYQLSISLTANGQTSDTKSINFGVRQFEETQTTINGTLFRGYKVNGQNIMIRGGGYVWDLLQRWDTKTNQAHIDYVKDMGLTAIRFEGTLGNEELYDMADKAGILLMPGFVCCSQWQSDNAWSAEETNVAYASLESQMRNLRAHASPFVFAFGSDQPPLAAHLAQYRAIAMNLHWQNQTLDNVASYSNASAGFKMDGPYVWEPPVLWWDTSQSGSAFGSTAEEGFESPPPLESQLKFLSAANTWPQGTAFNYHAGSKNPFDNIHWYTDGVNKRYGTTTSAQDYSNKSELLSYESTRAFFEAWNGNEYSSTFASIFWMQNNAWPSVHWNLYDYYFKPAGGFYGTKKADEPLHILYDYFGKNVKVVNSTLTANSSMTASVTIYNIPDLSVKYTNQVVLNVPADSATQAFTIPAVSGLSTTYFIRLQLKNSSGAVVSNNLYWYSTTPDALGNSGNWYSTSVRTYANLTGLNSLTSNSSVTASTSRTVASGQETVAITLTNTSSTNIAFFTRAEVTAGNNGLEVLPVTYTDNYVSLFPGESIVITAKYATADLGGQARYLRIRGYNVPTFNIAIP